MRKEVTVTVTAEGRDRGKVFRIREMSAFQAEAWAQRALLAIARSRVDVPDNVMQMGMAGVAYLGLQALSGMSYEEARPLLDEMMACCRALPDKQHPGVELPVDDTQVEEVGTLLFLRDEVFKLHTGFSLAAAFSNSKGQTSGTTTADPARNGQNSGISQTPSEPSSSLLIGLQRSKNSRPPTAPRTSTPSSN